MTKPTKLTFDIDPYQGAAWALSRMQLDGMRLVEMKRKGRKAVCSYLPVEELTPEGE